MPGAIPVELTLKATEALPVPFKALVDSQEAFSETDQASAPAPVLLIVSV